MRVSDIFRTPTRKVVTVRDLPVSFDRDDVIHFAMKGAGESPSSLFGWRCSTQYDDDGALTAIVTLHTD